jgi:hypothetical protein
MSKKKNKDQHYVSAFYLYHFTNSEQRKLSREKKRETKIWHYDKEKDCIKERPIKKIATESYLFSFMNKDCEYDQSLDDKLIYVEKKSSVYFEELFNIKAALKKGSKAASLNNSIMDAILEFVVWQIKRHPTLVNDVHLQCKEWIINSASNLNPKKMALSVVEQIGRDKHYDFENIFQRKNKVVFFTTKPFTSFITTDAPVVRFNKSSTNGIGMEGAEIYFPLTSNMLLFMCGDGNKKEFRLENDRAFIRELNNYIAKSAKNYIFSENEAHLRRIVKDLKA